MSKYTLNITFDTYNDFIQFVDYKRKFDDYLMRKTFCVNDKRGETISKLHKIAKELNEKDRTKKYKECLKEAGKIVKNKEQNIEEIYGNN